MEVNDGDVSAGGRGGHDGLVVAGGVLNEANRLGFGCGVGGEESGRGGEVGGEAAVVREGFEGESCGRGRSGREPGLGGGGECGAGDGAEEGAEEAVVVAARWP